MTAAEYCKLYKKSPDTAYEQLFSSYCSYVYAVVYNKLRSTASREDIEECVSDIFADIYFNYDTTSSFDGDMKGYISTIAKRKSIDLYRKLNARNIHISDSDDETLSYINSDTDIEADSDKAEMQTILLNAVEGLGEPDSTILIQKFYYDRSSSEIAELLSMKASAVRMRCGRAMEKLKSILSKAGITA